MAVIVEVFFFLRLTVKKNIINKAIHRAFSRTSKSKNTVKIQRLRLNKATRSPHYRNKGVGKRNKRYIREDKGYYCQQHYLLWCFATSTSSSFGMRQKYSPCFYTVYLTMDILCWGGHSPLNLS